ncbi:MAG: Gfo/Idh/MocA family oxidoreductase [Rhodothermales bacterium]
MFDKAQSRRSFLGTLGKAGVAVAAAPSIVPRHVLGGPGYRAPSDTVNVACVGVGGMGKVNLRNMDDVNVVALCDVDWEFSAPVFETYPNAARYWDYRRMLDDMSDQIDGVVIATPDHTHALITLAAMENGIHVYTQKPLTWSVREARQLGHAAERYDVVTQMGNQGRSEDITRDIAEQVKAGTIGDVQQVHVWTNRPIWPQGIEMPSVLKRTPDTLNWDLFLGPAAEMDYDPAFHPFSWRGWVPFGCGALGDIAAHSFAYVATALDLDAPTTVETRSSAFNGDSFPVATTTHYDFPRRGDRAPVKMLWYDGGFKPPRPDGLDDGDWLESGGMMYVGSNGTLLHMNGLQLLRNGRKEELPEVPKLYDRIENESHENNWLRAIRGEEEATSPFSFAAPLTETVLLGVVSLKAGNRKLHWDAENMRVTNISDANQFLRREARSGWELPTFTVAAGTE